MDLALKIAVLLAKPFAESPAGTHRGCPLDYWFTVVF
jgi:hypothetical protein